MRKWVVIGIVILGFILRIVAIDKHPVGFTPDEASFGYDAYSLLKTGKDQWGVSFPLVFRSFGDFKLPLYTYLTTPLVAIFGLTVFAVRLPNAILGSFAVVVVYFLAKKLFGEKVGLMASLLLAISPWHIALSRGAFEANLTTFFLPLGIFLFLSNLRTPRSLGVVGSALIFGLNLFSYHTARILTPLIVFYLIYRNWGIVKNKIILFLTIFGVSLLTAVYFYFIGGSRLASSGIFDLPFGDGRYLARLAGEPSVIARLLYNRPIFIVEQFLRSYLSYFSPQFLFTQGAGEGTYGMVPGFGVIYLIEFIFLAGFIIKAIKEKSLNFGFLIFWILVSPIPASLTKGPGYAANRAAFMLPALEIASAIGAVYLAKRYLIYGYVAVLAISLVLFAEKYLVVQSTAQAPAMLYGRELALDYVFKNESLYKKIIISRSLSEPQIYVAFFGKVDPIVYQNESQAWLRYESEGKNFVDQLGEYGLGKYVFSDINYQSRTKEQGTLLVGKPDEFPEKVNAVKTIYYPSGLAAIKIIKI